MPPYRIDAPSRTSDVVLKMNVLMVTCGPTSLSLRGIARASGISTGTLLQHYGNKARLLDLGAKLTSRERNSSLAMRNLTLGVEGLLPGSEDEIWWERAWTGWRSFFAHDAEMAPFYVRHRLEERGLVARRLSPPQPPSPQILPIQTLVEGLTSALCAPQPDLSLAEARRILTGYIETAC